MSEGLKNASIKKVVDMFNVFYSVPEYQRTYKWTETEVEQLLSDLWKQFQTARSKNGNNSQTTPYFLGSILVVQSGDKLSLIDGQQRLTTLLILYSTICFLSKKENPNINLSLFERYLFGQKGTLIPGKLFEILPRIHYGREPLDKVMKDLVEGKLKNNNQKAAERDFEIRRFCGAFDATINFLQGKKEENAVNNTWGEDIIHFGNFVAENVECIWVEVGSEQYAVVAFETMNSRGLELTALEIFKGILLGTLSRGDKEDYKKAITTWKQIQTFFDRIARTIHTWKFASISKRAIEKEWEDIFFKSYVMIYVFEGKIYNEDKERLSPKLFAKNQGAIHWALADHGFNEESTGQKDKNGEHFARAMSALDLMYEHAELFANMLECKFLRKESNLLKSIQQSDFYNPFFISTFLRKIEKLELEEYMANRLLEEYLKTFFKRELIDKQKGKKGADKYTNKDWIAKHKAIYELEDRDRILSCLNDLNKECDLNNEFFEAFVKLEDTNKEQIKYIFSCLESYICRCEQHNMVVIEPLEGINLEHILPQSEKGKNENKNNNIKNIGNLTLWEQCPNKSERDSPPEKKSERYRNSRFRITQSLSSMFTPHKNQNEGWIDILNDSPKINTENKWTEASIKNRAKSLGKLASTVWKASETIET